MRDLLDDDISHEKVPSSSGPRSTPEKRAGCIAFPEVSSEATTPPLRLTLMEMRVLWTTYENNVAPLVKVFHHPSLGVLYEKLSSGVQLPSSRDNAMFWAVNFAAVISLCPTECQTLLGRSKSHLARQYRHAAEQAFADAGLLNTSSISVLQAFLLFLTTMRRYDDTWLVLSLTGIAIRIALSVGLHRDGSKLGLDYFSTEMRRRMWWHLMLLDAELSDSHGVESLLRGMVHDTQMPNNLNDEDLMPKMTTTPNPRVGFASMSPNLVRYEIMLRSREILLQPGERLPSMEQDAMRSLNAKTKMIDDLKKCLDQRFLRHFSEDEPIQWATQVVVHVKCKMLQFGLYHPLALSEEIKSQHGIRASRDGLFALALDVTNRVRDLEANAKTRHWGWYFRSDTQWPALVYLLNEFIQRPPDPYVNHAWSMVLQTRQQYHDGRLPVPRGSLGARGMLFRPMRELTAKVFMVKDVEEFDIEPEVTEDSPLMSFTEAGDSSQGAGQVPNGVEEEVYRNMSTGLRGYPWATPDNQNLVSSDHLSVFQNFWGSRGPEAVVAGGPPASVFSGGQGFEDFLV